MSKKKSKLKMILTIFVVILIVLAALVAFCLIKIDSVATTAVNQIAPMVTGVDTSVEKIHVSLLHGRVEIKNFVMGNPVGFASPNAIQMGHVVADINWKGSGSEKIIIDEIMMKDVNVNFETNIVNSNLKTILDNMEKKEEEEEEQAEKTASSDETKKPAPKLQINKIELDDVGFSVYAKGVSTGVPIHVSMNPIGPLGEGEKGITPVSASVEVLTALLTTAVEKAGGSVTEAGKQIGSAAKDAAAGLGASAVEGIKNLFGSSDKDEKE